MYALHYAPLVLKKDIQKYEFKKHWEMLDFIDSTCIRRQNIVWLIGKDNHTDIFISDSYLSIIDFLKKKILWQTVGDFFLQEYKSFTEAYKVGLSMTEGHKLH